MGLEIQIKNVPPTNNILKDIMSREKRLSFALEIIPHRGYFFWCIMRVSPKGGGCCTHKYMPAIRAAHT